MKTVLYIFLFMFCMSITSIAQIDIKGKIKSQANNRANQRVDQGIDKGLDEAEEGVISVFKKDKDKDTEGDEESEENAESNDEESNDEEAAETKTESKPKETAPKLEAYSKYDFVPGEKVIFFEDFSQDAVGDFPALWNTDGSAEVVTTNLFPGKWMNFSCDEAIWTDALLNLPDNYTVEFDVIPTAAEDEEGMKGYAFRMIKSINLNSVDPGAIPGQSGFCLNVAYYGEMSYRAYNNEGQDHDISGQKDGDAYHQNKEKKYHIAIWVQKTRVRVYQNETKMFDLPKAFPYPEMKMDRIRFEYGAAMVSNIRIAVGNPDMRSKLLTEGKLVSYGIYFDVNKDVVKPESYGTLKGIATVLTENPDVKIKIIGHTDSDGADDANLDLSKRRSASVKNELVKTFGIDASRIETDGKGESVPIAANDLPANKALNRRVEFIKL
ncbi:MAG TPA: OmpA family protein [Bacteroidales bacterium]|jgi:outer membrane protein OmpA-like peptidoglycan-associated protein|nr:OmpA family protein [Bacteroidales bacterium]